MKSKKEEKRTLHGFCMNHNNTYDCVGEPLFFKSKKQALEKAEKMSEDASKRLPPCWLFLYIDGEEIIQKDKDFKRHYKRYDLWRN